MSDISTTPGEHFETMMELVLELVKPFGGDISVVFEADGIPDLVFLVSVDGVEWTRVVNIGEDQARQTITPTMAARIEKVRAMAAATDAGGGAA